MHIASAKQGMHKSLDVCSLERSGLDRFGKTLDLSRKTKKYDICTAMDGTIIFGESSEWSDDDAVYEAECTELNPKSHTSRIELFEPLPDYRDGAAKTSIKGSPTGLSIYHKEQSDCSVSIDRLVWVDGWRQGGTVDPMTLVVLKLRFDPEAPDARVSYASVRLRLKSDKELGKDPQLVAWGPFRHPEMWNVTKAQKRSNVSPSLMVSGGGGGQQISLGVNMEKEINWDENFSDYGLSAAKSNGVLWQVFENKLLKRGITPEVRVAALFSRPVSSDRYKVVLRVVAHTGLVRKAGHSILRAFGQQGGDKIYWSVEPLPGEKDNCHGEGVDIVKEIDPFNLGLITDRQDNTMLNPEWLNKWDRFETNPTAEPFSSLQKAKMPIDKRERPPPDTEIKAQHEPLGTAACPQVSGVPSELLPRAAATTAAPRSGLDESAPPLLDGNRLVALEQRAARAEARIAEQDRLILGLQQTLSRVAHALLIPTLTGARME